MRNVLETYPPSTYPKLYPKPIEYYKRGQWGFKLASRIIMVLGFVILFAVMFLVDHSTFADAESEYVDYAKGRSAPPAPV